jgi:nitrogen regulatory protein PII 1
MAWREGGIRGLHRYGESDQAPHDSAFPLFFLNRFRTCYQEQPMIMIRAILRPEKADAVLAAMLEAGFPAVTKMEVYGRGKQRGMKIGEVTYDELPKEMVLTVVNEDDKDFVIDVIAKIARTGADGAFGDGKIFVSPVSEVYTVRTGTRDDVPAVSTTASTS